MSHNCSSGDDKLFLTHGPNTIVQGLLGLRLDFMQDEEQLIGISVGLHIIMYSWQQRINEFNTVFVNE